MTDYQIQGSTRRCCKTGRELKPGERFHSALLDEKGTFSRLDYSPEGWEGPPPGAFSHWQGKLPKGDKPRRPPIDDDLLVECLTRLEGEKDSSRANFRFVLALLLLRRKRLRLDETRQVDGREVLALRDMKGGAKHEVIDPKLGDGELEVVQDEVFRVLGWD